MVGFDAAKQKALGKLAKASEKGEVDAPVMPYLKEINAHPDYFTSSSCYGRTLLIEIHGPRKIDSKFIARWHRPVKPPEARKALAAANGVIWLKFEPMILHVSCRDINAAQRILDVKKECGMKRGGIFHIAPGRVQIELEGTQRLATPVKEGAEQLVDDEYLKKLVGLCNERFENNELAWKKFGKSFSIHCKA